METLESNKLIADFMGMKQGVIVNGIGYYDPEELEYNKSWDWLMPVVEKIESMGNTQIAIGKKYAYFTIKGEDTPVVYGETRLLAIYKSVVQFIKWYNSQSK